MTPEDIDVIEQKAAAVAGGIAIRLAASDDERTDVLETFLKELSSRIDAVRYRKEDLPQGAPPAIKLPAGVEFHSVPTGRELPPFMDLLEALANAGSDAPETVAADHRQHLDALTSTCPLRLHIARGCPHCPKAVALWTRIAAASPYLRLSVVESDLFPEISRSDKVRAVPTLVFDATLRWTGMARPEDVLPVLADQDPARLDAAALESLIRDGEAAELARMMSRRQRIFPALFDLLTHPKWPTRLGAMVVLETLAAEDPVLAGEAVDPLVARYGTLDDQAKGDVLYTIGETAGDRLLPFLTAAGAETNNQELRNAADEAMDRIRERSAAKRKAKSP